MNDPMKDISLDTVGGGALPELFERELKRVLENIRDPNTDPEKQRKITLEVKISPSEDRSRAETSVQAKSKLAPAKAAEAPMYLGRRDGELVAVGFDPEQREIFDDVDEDVTPINAAKEAQDAGS